MNKRNAALEAIGRAPAPTTNVVPMATEQPAVQAAPAATAEKAPDYARVMVYTHPKVARKMKEIAFTEDRKANDIYLAALDLYLTQQGHGGIKGVVER